MGNRGQIQIAPYPIWLYTHFGGDEIIQVVVDAIKTTQKGPEYPERLYSSIKNNVDEPHITTTPGTDVFKNIKVNIDKKTVTLLYDFIDCNPELLFLGSFKEFVEKYDNGIGWDEENRHISIDFFDLKDALGRLI